MMTLVEMLKQPKQNFILLTKKGCHYLTTYVKYSEPHDCHFYNNLSANSNLDYETKYAEKEATERAIQLVVNI